MADLLRTYRHPPREFSPVPTWWWSGERVEPERLRWQLEQYAAGGVYNLVVLNLAAAGPMYGSDADDPYFFSERWWQLFLGACAEAKRLGMRLWFYDQIGFSGANFQGRFVSEHPAWGAQALESLAYPSGQPAPVMPAHNRLLGRYEDSARGQTRLVYAVDRGFDYFNPQACARLLDHVHGEFERRAGRYLGSVIAGSFQDELPSMPQWSPGFAAAFARHTGYDLLERLPALWEDAPGADQVRLDYHRVRGALAEEAFFIPLFRWHEKHGLLCGCDQQTPARAAEPAGSTVQYGDYARTHRWYGAPGSDHDGHAKLHSSLAHLYDRPRVWLEAFHSTGWGGTLEETFDWLLPWLRAGITLYAPHADYYSTRGGWWEWAAPSTCWRQPYWKHYPQFAATIARLCWLLSRGHHVCDLAVLYPTSTVQAGTLQQGRTEGARRADDAWRQLTGVMTWARTKPGWLDQWNRDYDALDEESLLRARVEGGRLVIGHESFGTVLLPACTHLPPGAARVLADFVAAGGQLVAVHVVPDRVPGDEVEQLARLREQFARGLAVCAADEDAARAAVQARPDRVEAPVPTLHRRHDGLHLLLVTATPNMATVVHPPSREWWARRSYDFSARRYATTMDVLLRDARSTPFLLDPFDGERKPVAWRRTENGVVVTVPFANGPAQIVAWSEEAEDGLPAGPKFQPLEKPVFTFSNDWKSELVPTLDNRHGDFTRPAAVGAPPVQTWSFRHAVEQGAWSGLPLACPVEAREVQAGFGRMGWRQGPCPLADLDQARLEEVVYSPARGLFKDPVHIETLGPKGHVAEDFIHFGTTEPGQGVRFRTGLWLDSARATHLAVGSAGAKRAWVNGRPIVESSAGYWWLTPIRLQAGYNTVEWEVAPEVRVNLRAAWCLVDDPAAFARPEWLTTREAPHAHTLVRFSTTWNVRAESGLIALHLGCDAPCRLLIDGVERGRQGGFDPYKITMRVERYELESLSAGTHDVTLEVRDVGQPMQVLVDARSEHGAALMTGPGWWMAREKDAPRTAPLHRPQFKEPGWSHVVRRPHPLPRAAWLEGPSQPGVVVDVTPDAQAGEGPAPAEWLWWQVPPGATSMQVPAGAPFRVWLRGQELAVASGGRVDLPGAESAGAREVAVRLQAGRGRYGGGLLDGPVTYTTAAGCIRLGDWTQQGLACYAGGVRYVQDVAWSEPVRRELILDLGAVRGTVEVEINGKPAGARFVGPYRFAVGPLIQPGANRVSITVYNTLAPWLEAHSPTRCIWQNTTVSGLLGPVQLLDGSGLPS